MKKQFTVLLFLFLCTTAFSQINKHHWEFNTVWYPDEPFLSSGLDYYRNFKIKEKSYWSFLFSSGVVYSVGDLNDEEIDYLVFPYVQAGVDYNISSDGVNFFNMGISTFYIVPEFHLGLRHVNPKNGHTFRFYLSDIYDLRDHYFSMGISLSVFMRRKGLNKNKD